MKVLQTVETLDPETGGVSRAVTLLSEGLRDLGHQVEIVALDEPTAPWLRAQSVPVHALGRGVMAFRFSQPLRRWLREHVANFDCAIAHGIWQYHALAVSRSCRWARVPYFIFPHGMLDPWFRRTFPLKHLKKWLFWPWADYRVLRDASAVIFTSEEERLLARESFPLYRVREKVSPLGLSAPSVPVSEAKDLFAKRFPEVNGTRMLLFLGRIHPKKGCDLLIEALAKVETSEPLTLVFAGPDQVGWTRDLRASVARHQLSGRVLFTGMLEGALKRSAFACADAFVLPSHQENFGLAVVEALACGVPVLISNRVNIWREIEADAAALVEDDDLAGTIRLLERWARKTAAERDDMRAHARACFQRRFELRRAAESLRSILEGR